MPLASRLRKQVIYLLTHRKRNGCVIRPHTPRFNEWLLAEKEASEAERLLHRQMLQSSSGAAAPEPNLVLMARAKRAKAQWLFDEAMQEMKALAESLHHRHIDTRPTPPSAEADQQH